MELHGLCDPVAIDFETFYDSKYSLKRMTTFDYVSDPRFDAYLVALHDHTGTIFVGNPREFDWSRLTGRDLLAHNAGFDGLVFQRLQELGIVPQECRPRGFTCTADMAAYLRIKRDLATTSKVLLGRELDKAMRDIMKGKTWAQAVAEGLDKRLTEYGGGDGGACYDVFKAGGDKWPAHEQRLSRLNREAGWKGVYLDQAKLDRGIASLQDQLLAAGRSIPWEWDTEDGTPLSLVKARQQCRADGIPAPSSFAADNEDCMEWEKQYEEQYPWIAALRNWRRMNMLLQKLQTMKRGTMPNGFFRYALKYFGAHSGRFSGSEKFNIQNLPRDPMFGVDLRSIILADPDCWFVPVDLAQIEARVLLWLVGDEVGLNLVRSGMSVYQAHAVATMGWPAEKNLKIEDKKLYGYAKARVLGLGFGCGNSAPYYKFRRFAEKMGVKMTDEEASQTVQDYRAANPRVTAFWRRMQNAAVYAAIEHQDVFSVKLPSGRCLEYFEPTAVETKKGYDVSAYDTRGDQFKRKLYGGLLTENIVQALARDIFVDGWLRAVDAGFDVRFTVHDEYVPVVKGTEKDAKEAAVELQRMIAETAEWVKGLPIGAEAQVSRCYLK